jgi:hypothetical protein
MSSCGCSHAPEPWRSRHLVIQGPPLPPSSACKDTETGQRTLAADTRQAQPEAGTEEHCLMSTTAQPQHKRFFGWHNVVDV